MRHMPQLPVCSYAPAVTIFITDLVTACCNILQLFIYLRPSYCNDTLILAIFVSMDLAHINFSDFTKNYSLFKQ